MLLSDLLNFIFLKYNKNKAGKEKRVLKAWEEWALAYASEEEN